MGRKRRDKDQVAEDTKAGPESTDAQAVQEPEPDDTGQKTGSRRGRKLVLLLAVAGTATWLVRRNQRKAELDEGIWHEAPAPPAPTPASPTTA
jgi:hypothetical protein